jgi:hypothetical protein
MEFTLKHTDLIYSALDIILDDDGTNFVLRDDDIILFRTDKGINGVVLKNKAGDMDVIIKEKCVYTIEKEVYLILSYGSDIPPLEVFTPMLINLYYQNLQHKSKILVGRILEGIAQMVISKIISVNLDKKFGPLSYVRNANHEIENFLSEQ